MSDLEDRAFLLLLLVVSIAFVWILWPLYVVLVATLGGLAIFGFNGFVIGPVVAAVFMATWETFGRIQARTR